MITFYFPTSRVTNWFSWLVAVKRFSDCFQLTLKPFWHKHKLSSVSLTFLLILAQRIWHLIKQVYSRCVGLWGEITYWSFHGLKRLIFVGVKWCPEAKFLSTQSHSHSVTFISIQLIGLLNKVVCLDSGILITWFFRWVSLCI